MRLFSQFSTRSNHSTGLIKKCQIMSNVKLENYMKWIKAGFMKDSGLSNRINQVVVEYKFGLMDLGTKGFGKKENPMAMVGSSMQKVMFMSAVGRMMRLMAMECTSIAMVINMKVSGSMISSMEKAPKCGQMVPCTLVSM